MGELPAPAVSAGPEAAGDFFFAGPICPVQGAEVGFAPGSAGFGGST